MHHRFHLYFGRHHAGRGLGRFGKGFMEGGMGGRAFGMGRKLASVDLQLIILGLLADKPHHGYEIIKALDERSKGFYVPSPGMVYPALTFLEEIGHATIEADGNRKRYHITDAGRRYLEEHRARADALFGQFDQVGERMDRLRQAMSAGATDDESLADNAPSGTKELRLAVRELRGALQEKWRSPRDEQLRIAGILKQAAAGILGKVPRG
jgi:DNA-binding PadR family transcriptional regulator